MKRVLIAGIDPGTTLGYAMLDLNGNLVRAGSSKQLDMSSLIMEMIKEGKVVLIGTDKGKVPKFIEKIARKTGARVIKPNEDLKIEEKRELTKGYKLKSEHEKDALASAVYAFKRVRKLLRKVDVYLERQGKEGLSEEVKEMVLKDRNLRIAEAIALIEKPAEETEKKRKRKKTARAREDYFDEDTQEESTVDVERKTGFMKGKINRMAEEKARNKIRIKDQQIGFLTGKIREKEGEIKKLREKIEKFEGMIKKAETHYILKKMKNLSWEEVASENLGKIIYVNEPNIFSEKSISKLNSEVSIIITGKELSKKISGKFKPIFLDAKKVEAEEEDGIVLVNKEKLEKEKNKVNIVKKIVEEYRETRG